MLRVQSFVREINRLLAPIVREIDRHDSSLADQMRRASASVVLNLAEGRSAYGRNSLMRYYTALGSLREVQAALDFASDFEYVSAIDSTLSQRIDTALAMIYGLIRAK